MTPNPQPLMIVTPQQSPANVVMPQIAIPPGINGADPAQLQQLL